MKRNFNFQKVMKLSNVIASLALVVTTVACKHICYFIFHQPEPPISDKDL